MSRRWRWVGPTGGLGWNHQDEEESIEQQEPVDRCEDVQPMHEGQPRLPGQSRLVHGGGRVLLG